MSDSAEFDELIHAPTRLRLCAALEPVTALEFGVLEEGLGISTSLLSKQLRVLADAGYVTLAKRRQAVGRPRTWVSLTASGRGAYRRHVAALRAIIASGSSGPDR
ncbi:transcriptional regulator [Propioniciclava soli]|uniref:Transcriptional regulator n=1 Tax=Propioniciclava soli TaxID=2775081 RepID=A0ABZ3C5I6_9ACTN